MWWRFSIPPSVTCLPIPNTAPSRSKAGGIDWISQQWHWTRSCEELFYNKEEYFLNLQCILNTLDCLDGYLDAKMMISSMMLRVSIAKQRKMLSSLSWWMMLQTKVKRKKILWRRTDSPDQSPRLAQEMRTRWLKNNTLSFNLGTSGHSSLISW